MTKAAARRLRVAGCFVFLLAVETVAAQSPAPPTLAQAVRSALANYPSIRVSREQLNAAAAGIQLARTAYLPRVDALAQVNRATRNNLFGLLLPQSVIPSISGPVIGSNNFGSVWGSAAGVLVTWEPFDFGLRRASVEAANAARAQSEASVKRTQFDVAVSAADAWLTLVAAQETVKAAQAGVDRADTIVRTTTAQVNAQLRPGADQSRAEAELAAARTQLIQAQEAVDTARVTLSQLTGSDLPDTAIGAAALAQLPPEQTPSAVNIAANPAALEQNAVV
ncbi:MAG TPA: TolC family protein, partial [Bryobacteraceae bacterium]|nr:TolC family protein [Bryobacteraceae bacterium]